MSAGEHREELLELWWTAAEDGLGPLDRARLPQRLVCFDPHPIEPAGESSEDAVRALLANGSLRETAGGIELTDQGRALAREVVRRHRLAEVLLAHVLAVSEESMESTACQFEHLLNEEVTAAVCAFLGHPPACPHGRAIPRGRCCLADEHSRPLLVPLAQLPVGEEAVVAFTHSGREGYLRRLGSFGVVPGRRLQLRQTRPTLVIALGQTELALDRQAGQEIYVRRGQPSSIAKCSPDASLCCGSCGPR